MSMNTRRSSSLWRALKPLAEALKSVAELTKLFVQEVKHGDEIATDGQAGIDGLNEEDVCQMIYVVVRILKDELGIVLRIVLEILT